jgi:hypothetical protein
MNCIKYYNPKNNRYQISEILKIEKDVVFCYNKKANYHYQESLKNLIELSEKENPNWHGATKKPLIIIKYGNYTI